MTLCPDKSYLKVFHQYNPFDDFQSKLPEINTLSDKIKKMQNKKMKVKGTYSYDDIETLTLVRDNKIILYKINFEVGKLIIMNEVIEPGGHIMKVYQRFERIK